MKLVTISLTKDEIEKLEKICKKKNIKRHKAIKLAIQEYIKRFERIELHHRMPDGKFVECR